MFPKDVLAVGMAVALVIVSISLASRMSYGERNVLPQTQQTTSQE